MSARTSVDAPAAEPTGASGLRRVAGERVGGLTYGTVVALSAVVAGARAYPDDAGAVAELVLGTSGFLWLAHVYANSLGESVGRGRRLRFDAVLRVARHELSVIEAALPPCAALLLGAFGLLSAGASLWLSFGVGLGVLAAVGIGYARTERLGPLGTGLVVAANLAFGLILVELKLSLGH